MLIYHFGKKNKWLLLFLAVWGITTINIFLKAFLHLFLPISPSFPASYWRKHYEVSSLLHTIKVCDYKYCQDLWLLPDQTCQRA